MPNHLCTVPLRLSVFTLRSLLSLYCRTGLHHLLKAHPLCTPPRPNPLHAVALQVNTGLILGLRPSPGRLTVYRVTNLKQSRSMGRREGSFLSDNPVVDLLRFLRESKGWTYTISKENGLQVAQ